MFVAVGQFLYSLSVKKEKGNNRYIIVRVRILFYSITLFLVKSTIDGLI